MALLSPDGACDPSVVFVKVIFVRAGGTRNPIREGVRVAGASLFRFDGRASWLDTVSSVLSGMLLRQRRRGR